MKIWGTSMFWMVGWGEDCFLGFEYAGVIAVSESGCNSEILG